jgi:hypothetical protein
MWATNTKNAEHKATTEGSASVSLKAGGQTWSGLGSGATWMLGTSTELPAELSAKKEKALSLSTEILKVKTTFTCETISTEGALLETEGKSSGKLVFSGCKGATNGSPNANCTPKSNGLAEGSVRTNALKGQLVSNEGETLERIEPVTGTTIVKLEMKEACPVGETVPINGVFYAKDAGGKFETESLTHVLEAGPLTDMWATNTKNAEHKATTEGSASVSLKAGGQTWSGLGI